MAANSVVTSTCASAAPIIGGIGVDFFASHFTWTCGGQDVTVPAWTFLFGLACVVGLYSMHRLSFVEETGRTSDHVALRHLLLEVRRPPVVDPARPLRGRTIALDPGHPPLGARGPTGLWEPVATLAVALKAKTLLERSGASVLLTRTDTTAVELYPRTRFAELHDADILVSIHANALPDGINPFTNSGTSVYYFHPRSTRLARELDRALVAELGVRDLGIGRGDYALARPTWMPAALTEALFIMLPDQEAMLASEDGQWRYARGVVNGIENFLRERAREP